MFHSEDKAAQGNLKHSGVGASVKQLEWRDNTTPLTCLALVAVPMIRLLTGSCQAKGEDLADALENGWHV